MKKKAEKVVIAMSGGVDSSVAAKIIKDQGFETLGIFLHFWKDPEVAGDYENKCCSAKAFMDARRVCNEIKMTLYTMNFAKVFKKDIVDNFINEYKSGNTPNPCVRCNKLVKLGLLIKRAEKLGYDKVASGHYVRLKKTGTKYRLFKGKDDEKDQSYFLWALTQEQLSHLLFPLGDYKKPEVRKMATKYKLPVAQKSESQEVCFIPEKSHNEFLKRYLKLKKGKIKNLDGNILGEHKGLPLYTIGQRRGVEIGGTGPYYVAKLNYKTNTLYVVNDYNDPTLFNDGLVAKEINWTSGSKPKLPLKCEAVIRYRHKPVDCKIEERKGKYLVKLNEPQRAVTPGQSIVFYKKEEVIGGGVIDIVK